MRFIKLQIPFIALLFLSLHAIGQNKALCKIGSVDFSCPSSLQIDKNKLSKNLFVGFDAKNKVYVYAFSAERTANSDELIEKYLSKVFSNTYSAKYKDYKIKNSNDFWGNSTFSQYEVGKFAKVGFNEEKNHILHFQYVRLLLNEQQIVAGFLYERAAGENAETEFNNWRGGGNGAASADLQEMISNIMGEKRNTLVPGGPPPPAAPPRPKP
jgi:hypothetical protein